MRIRIIQIIIIMVVISLSSHTYVSHAEGYLKIVGKRLGKLWVELQHLQIIMMTH